MRIVTMSLFALILAGCASIPQRANLSDSERTPYRLTWERTQYFQDKRFDFEIAHSLIDNAPDWNPHEGNPPLSVSDAVRVATAKFHSITRGLPISGEGFHIEDVGILAMSNDKWMYGVNFVQTNVAGVPDNLTIFVLMNGHVVEPQISQDLRD